jgi:hypothetical protein
LRSTPGSSRNADRFAASIELDHLSADPDEQLRPLMDSDDTGSTSQDRGAAKPAGLTIHAT